ncbi:hypothetical protein, partial [Actinomycetospora atypica]
LPPNTALILGPARHPAVVRFEAGYERLARERTAAARVPFWPRWWRQPLLDAARAFEFTDARPLGR